MFTLVGSTQVREEQLTIIDSCPALDFVFLALRTNYQVFGIVLTWTGHHRIWTSPVLRHVYLHEVISPQAEAVHASLCDVTLGAGTTAIKVGCHGVVGGRGVF